MKTSNNPYTLYRIVIKSVTWSRDSHGLYDYESRNVQKKVLNLNSACQLLREGSEVKQIQSLPLASSSLCNVSTESSEFFLNAASEPIWLVARTMKTKHGPGFVLTEGNIIKLGRVCFKVSTLRTTCESEESDKTQDSDELDLGIPNERESGACKICLSNDSDSTDPLISPCKCAGSMKYIHLECLRSWIKSRMISRNTDNCITFSWKSIDCEICKSGIPFAFEGAGSELLSIQKPKSPFIVLEGVGNDKNSNKGVHVIAVTGSCEILLGRGHEADVRISDISVSRTHAGIRFVDGCFVMEDKSSKFGTLLACEDKVKISQMGSQVVQIGRTILSFSGKQGQSTESFDFAG